MIVDDDSFMRASLKHQCINPKEILSRSMPQPEWSVDTLHQTKVVAKYMYNLNSLPRKASPCTKVETIRFKNALATC